MGQPAHWQRKTEQTMNSNCRRYFSDVVTEFPAPTSTVPPPARLKGRQLCYRNKGRLISDAEAYMMGAAGRHITTFEGISYLSPAARHRHFDHANTPASVA